MLYNRPDSQWGIEKGFLAARFTIMFRFCVKKIAWFRKQMLLRRNRKLFGPHSVNVTIYFLYCFYITFGLV